MLDENSGATAAILGRALGMLDSVLYTQDSDIPDISYQGSVTTIHTGKGLYFFATNDLFQDYAIVSDGFTLRHRAK